MLPRSNWKNLLCCAMESFDHVKTLTDVAAVPRRAHFRLAPPKYAVVYIPSQRAGRRVSIKGISVLRSWNQTGTDSFSATWEGLDDCGRDITYDNAVDQTKQFKVLALAEKLPPDWAWNLALELNEVETNMAMSGGNTFTGLCRAFGPTLVLGEPFLLDRNMVSSHGRNSTALDCLAKHISDLGDGVKGAVAELSMRVGGMEAELKKAVTTRDEETYVKMRTAVKSASLPYPFDDIAECEKYMKVKVNYGIAQAAFNSDDAVLKAKAATAEKVSSALSEAPARGKRKFVPDPFAGVTFPARLPLRFLLSDKALSAVESKTLLLHLGNETRRFLVERSRFVMGKEWQRTDAYILKKIRKSFGDSVTYSNKKPRK